MKKIRVKMLGDASWGDKFYKKGEIIDIFPSEYANIRQSCEIVTEAELDLHKGKIDVSNKLTPAHRILVVISHGIGNTINKTPMLQALREYYPNVRLDVLLDKRCVQVLEGWDILDNIYAYGTGIGAELRDLDYDIIINTVPSGLNINVIGLYKNTITAASKLLKDMHEVEVNMHIIKGLGIRGDIPNPYIQTKKTDLEPGNYIGICAGYIGDKFKIKNWGYKRYAELITLILEKQPDLKIMVFGTGKDNKIFNYLSASKIVANVAGRIINTVDKYTLQESAYNLTLCKFLICNDTGLGHVASAAGVKTYTIFGPSNVTKNHPYLKSHVISRELECQPCQYTNKWTKCKKLECLKIPPAEVYDIVFNNETEESKQQLGLLINTYNRYEYLYVLLQSLLRADSFKDLKVCIVDDHSTDPDIKKLICKFKDQVEDRNIEVMPLFSSKHLGKKDYSKLLKIGARHLIEAGCSYILFSPDDIVINPHLFKVIKRAISILKKDFL